MRRIIAMDDNAGAGITEKWSGHFIVAAGAASCIDCDDLIIIRRGIVRSQGISINSANLRAGDGCDNTWPNCVAPPDDLIIVDHQITGVGLRPLQVYDIADTLLR